MSRADKLAATRDELLAAAARIVGLEGYAGASVGKITARARVAQGTFYNYFSSQQDLFEQLLPELGQQLLAHVRGRLAGVTEALQREEIGFNAFFEFLDRNPEFYRILNEAETFSPKAFRDHMDNMIRGYRRALRRSKAEGRLAGYREEELDVIVCILLAARNYLAYHYIYRDGTHGRLPPMVIDAYMKFVAGGVGYGAGNGRGQVPRLRSPASRAPGLSIDVVNADRAAAMLTAQITDAQRDPSGAVRRAVVFELIEAAGAAVAGREAARGLRLVNMSLGGAAPTTAATLVAQARCEQQEPGVVQVNVRVTADAADGPLAAAATLVFVGGG